jgi:hypothetical protein
MNQLIEKFIAESTICQGHPQIDGSYFDKEKFAELIVRECAAVALREDHEPSECILRHFGVKE